MSLHIITGCMFSGKTSELLNRYSGSTTPKLLVNHISDSRYNSESNVTSHRLHTSESLAMASLEQLRNHAEYKLAEEVFIDEAQFFEELRDNVLFMVEKDRKHVTLSGLNGDFMRRPLGQLNQLLPYADTCVLLRARCVQCDKNALFSYKKDDRKMTIQVSASQYFPLCRDHYLNETANSSLLH